jgi:hypothetical protein
MRFEFLTADCDWFLLIHVVSTVAVLGISAGYALWLSPVRTLDDSPWLPSRSAALT